MNVLLVCAGDKYDWRYVTALKRQIFALREGHRIVTLTDRMNHVPGKKEALRMGWPGWWAKLELFAPWNRKYRPALYIDLDSFVFASIAKYANGDTFTMVRDFSGHHRIAANSSVMWLPKDTSDIWDAFSADPQRGMARCKGHGDQKFLAPFAKHLWGTPDDGIVSYKQHGRDGPCGHIMQFHGTPKMPDAKGWAQEHWRKLTNCPPSSRHSTGRRTQTGS